jgi:hypothetical protein
MLLLSSVVPFTTPAFDNHLSGSTLRLMENSVRTSLMVILA